MLNVRSFYKGCLKADPLEKHLDRISVEQIQIILKK